MLYPAGTVIKTTAMEGVVSDAENEKRIIKWKNGVTSYVTITMIQQKVNDGDYAI